MKNGNQNETKSNLSQRGIRRKESCGLRVDEKKKQTKKEFEAELWKKRLEDEELTQKERETLILRRKLEQHYARSRSMDEFEENLQAYRASEAHRKQEEQFPINPKHLGQRSKLPKSQHFPKMKYSQKWDQLNKQIGQVSADLNIASRPLHKD